jgi:hypothetical protein
MLTSPTRALTGQHRNEPPEGASVCAMFQLGATFAVGSDAAGRERKLDLAGIGGETGAATRR